MVKKESTEKKKLAGKNLYSKKTSSGAFVNKRLWKTKAVSDQPAAKEPVPVRRSPRK